MLPQWVYNGLVYRVVDGDTYDIILDLGFSISHKIRVRLKGVDTPEVYGKEACEEGRAASEYVKKIIQDKHVFIKTYKNAPSTFNRWEADVMFTLLNEDGSVKDVQLDLASHLVSVGHAKRVNIKE